jgi:hypothetical protein
MARIRTIKPQFWTDEKIGKLPLGARLLFIGLWNLADDEGIVLWNAAYIKGQLFPYDTRIRMSDINRWMNDITSLKLVACYVDVQRNIYGFVSTWHIHQKINKPQPTQHKDILDMIRQQNSRNDTGTFTEHSTPEWNKETDKEWNKEEEGIHGISPTNFSDKSTEENNSLKSVVAVFESCGGIITSQMVAENLADAEKEYGAEIVIAAFKKASKNSVNSARLLSYCQPIFEQYKTHGIPVNYVQPVPGNKASGQVEGMIVHE